MARKKVTLQYISNNSTRRSTFEKRSQSLMKKAGQVATMCNAKACIIVYGEGESVPQVFPSHNEAVDILERFKTIEEYEKFHKKIDQERFLYNHVGKLQNHARKSKCDYEEREIRFLIHKAMLEGHEGLSIQELTNVDCKVEVLLKGISDRIAKVRGHPPIYQPSHAQVLAPYDTGAMETIGTSTQVPVPPQQNEEWLDLMMSGGGDLGDLVYGALNGSVNTMATTGLSMDETMHTFDLDKDFSCPRVDTDPGRSSSSSPHM